MNYILLLGSTVIFGFLGGIVNAIREEMPKKSYWKAVVKGISAAFLVPFFLFIVRSEISNSLTRDVDDLGIELYNYIVYGGLCLIAAIFSDNFFDSIADKILKKVENAEQMAVESNEKADALIEINAEPENSKESGIQISKRKEYDSITLDIIDALDSKKYEFRTISGIAQDVNQTQETVKRKLLSLVSDDVVTKVGSGRRVLWALNGKGQN